MKALMVMPFSLASAMAAVKAASVRRKPSLLRVTTCNVRGRSDRLGILQWLVCCLFQGRLVIGGDMNMGCGSNGEQLCRQLLRCYDKCVLFANTMSDQCFEQFTRVQDVVGLETC